MHAYQWFSTHRHAVTSLTADTTIPLRATDSGELLSSRASLHGGLVIVNRPARTTVMTKLNKKSCEKFEHVKYCIILSSSSGTFGLS